MRLLVTRPEPDASLEAEKLAARGHEAVVAPLLVIEVTSGVKLNLEGVQASIVTSRNALRALAAHRQRGEAVKLPLFAVGQASAGEARELGFADVIEGPGTGAGLAEMIARILAPNDVPLLYLAGETLAFDLKSALEERGFKVRRQVLYRAIPAGALSPEALAVLRGGSLDGVILMSPRTARTFAALAERHGAVTQAKRLICYCLSEAVADALAPLGYRVRVAASPREEDVLALLDAEAASL